VWSMHNMAAIDLLNKSRPSRPWMCSHHSPAVGSMSDYKPIMSQVPASAEPNALSRDDISAEELRSLNVQHRRRVVT
jgi:hypothetical protein